MHVRKETLENTHVPTHFHEAAHPQHCCTSPSRTLTRNAQVKPFKMWEWGGHQNGT